MMNSKDLDHVIFDLGGVLVDWDPRYLFRKVFTKEEEMESFLHSVCSPDWNEQQDGGRSIEDAGKYLISLHPQFEKEILMFYGRWTEMLNGSIAVTEQFLRDLHDQKSHKLVALTNWSAETFPIAQHQFDFLGLFEDIVVSGIEKCKKPDPKIYQILIDRTGLIPERSLFIDDSARNIKAAEEMGFQVYHFTDPEKDIEILRSRILSR